MNNKQKIFFCIGLAILGIIVLFNWRSKTVPVSPDETTADNNYATESESETQEIVSPARIRYEKDLIYDADHEDTCRVDVAYKRDGTKKPLLICVHGGYYSSGTKEDMKEYLSVFPEAGYVTASIDYPLLPDGTIVTQIDSVIKAVDYFRAHADIYEIDKDKITLLGFSSGAHITVSAAEKISERKTDNFALAGVIDISGPTDYRYLIKKYGGADTVSPAIIDGNDEADLLEELKKVDCTDNITKNLPGVMIIHGKLDDTVPYQVSKRFYNSLTKAGVAAEIELIDEMGHATDMKTVIPLIKLFLER